MIGSLVTLCFIAFDFITGIIKAIYKKEFTSSGMRDGMFHKFAEILICALACGVDKAGEFIELGLNIEIAKAVFAYIILMELASIIENIGIINPKLVPAKIRECFGKIGN